MRLRAASVRVRLNFGSWWRPFILLGMVMVGVVVSAATLTIETGDSSKTVARDECGQAEWIKKGVSGNYEHGTLRAEPAKGYVFTGWSIKDQPLATLADVRNLEIASLDLPIGTEVEANFEDESEDSLLFDFTNLLGDLTPGEEISLPLDVESSLSYPTLTFSGLPPGLQYDPRRLQIFGAPTQPGKYEVKVSGSTASGFKFTQVIDAQVENWATERVLGENLTISVGESFSKSFEDLFVCDDQVVAVSLSGVPPGLTWKASWRLLYGTPTRAGDYTVTAKVFFADHRMELATLVMSVVPPLVEDCAQIDLSFLEGLSVGDVLETSSCMVGSYTNSQGVIKVMGLPSGLREVRRKDESSPVVYSEIEGMVTRAGRYTVQVKVKERDTSNLVTRVYQQRIEVEDTPFVYLMARLHEDEDPTTGTVTGGGAMSVASAARVKAKAAKNYVFAGWYNELDNPVAFESAIDYRQPVINFPAGTDYANISLYARFKLATEDYLSLVFDEDLDLNDGISFSPDEEFESSFKVESPSLPTLTLKGAPKGITLEPREEGLYAFCFRPSTGVRPAPGYYAATLTAVNVSGHRASATIPFWVANETNACVKVEDLYDQIRPGEEMEAIDLSQAVRFDAGETLSIQGLPRGLTFNRQANAEKGIAAWTITGVPTVPGFYTLNITARVASSTQAGKFETVRVTSSMHILPYPELKVGVDEEASSEGNVVRGEGNYKPGTKVTLRAQAAPGWVFAGWSGLPETEACPLAELRPSQTLLTSTEALEVTAEFLRLEADYLELFPLPLTSAGYAAELELNQAVDETEFSTFLWEVIASGSLPQVTVKGLPEGVRFDASTFRLKGAPKRSGSYWVTVSATNSGGYSFVQLYQIAVLTASGDLPSVTRLKNEAEIDFSESHWLKTGEYLDAGECCFWVPPHPEQGVAVKKVTVSGLPKGVQSKVEYGGEGALVSLCGVASTPGRFVITVQVAYSGLRTLKSQGELLVEDGGSYYVSVRSLSPACGEVQGSGVYAAGETVKFVVKPEPKNVFAGWYEGEGEEVEELLPFVPLHEKGATDYRKPTLSFVLCPSELAENGFFSAAFVATEKDEAPVFSGEDDEPWVLSREMECRRHCEVKSCSLPTVTLKGAPKGMRYDLASGELVFSPDKKAVPGIYTVTLTAKNVSKKTATTTLEVQVPNLTSPVIDGLDPDLDAYHLVCGAQLPTEFLVPSCDEEWKLSVAGLPSGLSFKNGEVVGVPTRAGTYVVTFTASSRVGTSVLKEQSSVVLQVEAFPREAQGTFYGYLLEADEVVGTMSLTVGSTGKISGQVVTSAGSTRFSASHWDEFASGEGVVQIALKNDDWLELQLQAPESWQSWAVEGALNLKGHSYSLVAQRAFLADATGPEDVLAEYASRQGTYAFEALRLKLQPGGTATLSGRVGTFLLSASAPVLYEDGFSIKFLKYLKSGGKISVFVDFWDNEEEPSWEVFEN